MNKSASSKYIYGEESNMNLKLVIAIRRSLLPEDRAVVSVLNKYGLTISQFGVLESLYHIGPMNINEIISKTLSTSGNMTVVIRNLVKQGLVTKECDPEDRRAFIIKLTDAGRSKIKEIFPKHLDELDRVFSTLEMDEKKELLRLLKKLNRYDSDK